jgi:thioredoxin-like negative regulator of GroEL
MSIMWSLGQRRFLLLAVCVTAISGSLVSIGPLSRNLEYISQIRRGFLPVTPSCKSLGPIPFPDSATQADSEEAFEQEVGTLECLIRSGQRIDIHKFLLGNVYWRNEQTNEAVDAWRSMEEDPGFSFVCLSAWKEADFAEAVIACRKALLIEPKNYTAMAALGSSYARLNMSAAGSVFRQLHPSAKLPATGLYADYSEYLIRVGRLADADKVVKAGLALAPSDSRLLFLSGKVRFAQGQFDDAARLFEDSLVHSDQPTAFMYLMLGESYLGMGDKQRALATLMQVSKISGKDEYSFHRALSLIHQIKGSQ